MNSAMNAIGRSRGLLWRRSGEIWKVRGDCTATRTVSNRWLSTGHIASPPMSNSSTTATATQPQQQQEHPSYVAMVETNIETMCPATPLVFDTHKLVTYLKMNGLSMNQSEAITNAIVRISQQSSRHHSEQMVTKGEFEGLRAELSILEKADFALLKTDINSIEKRLETSVAEIYTAVERVENRVIKWVIAVAGAIGLGIIRMLSTSSPSSSSSSSSMDPYQHRSVAYPRQLCRQCPPGLCATCIRSRQVVDT